MRNRTLSRKWTTCFAGAVALAAMFLLANPARAVDIMVGDSEGTVMGYINQGASFSLHGDKYDTKKDFNSMIFQFLMEVRLNLDSDLRFFGSTLVNVEYAYPILSENNAWHDKAFDRSRDRLYVFDDYRDLLKELHITWTPGDFFFRLGKQVVKWGETDGIRLMDQINPLDQRRGLADVEFETTVVPILMLRAEYFFSPQTEWLTDLAIEFVFDPSIDFRGNLPLNVFLGNDTAGVWAPLVKAPVPPPLVPQFGPFGYVGSYDIFWNSPGSWDPDAFRYGIRIKPIIFDAIVTLNWFYGIDNQPALKPKAGVGPRIEINAFDGRPVFHLPREAKFPDLHLVGFTVARDIPQLYLSFLGGVAPVFRTEFLYAFDSSFTTSLGQFEEHNELRYAVGMDWKAKINFLNRKAYFFISPQFFQRVVFDYPDDYTLTGNVEDQNLVATLLINTTYLHNKLQPMFFWQRDITYNSNLFKIQAVWEQSDHWNFTVGVLFFDGRDEGVGPLEPFKNKDQLYTTIAYRF